MTASGAVDTCSAQVHAGGVLLEGDLNLPRDAEGVVLFAHGSGSGRHSSRNRMVAHLLNERGLATLLIDLLTAGEDAIDRYTAQHRFDIPLLAERLVGATDWLAGNPHTAKLPVGIFGASTGGGAALIAAVAAGGKVGAVVSRGGRPDLAASALPEVRAPTLLIVGGHDPAVIDLNKAAYALLNCEKSLVVIPGATHLFEEPGALDEVARSAGDWFLRHLRK